MRTYSHSMARSARVSAGQRPGRRGRRCGGLPGGRLGRRLGGRIGCVSLAEFFAGGGERAFGCGQRRVEPELDFFRFEAGALATEPADFGEGAFVRALEGGHLSPDPEEQLAGGGIAEDGDVDGFGSETFGEQLAVEAGMDALEAAALPIGVDEGLDLVFLEDALGVDLAAVIGGDAFVERRIFAGDEDGSGVGAVLEGVYAGSEFAIGGG